MIRRNGENSASGLQELLPRLQAGAMRRLRAVATIPDVFRLSRKIDVQVMAVARETCARVRKKPGQSLLLLLALGVALFLVDRAMSIGSRLAFTRRFETPLFEDRNGTFLSDGQSTYGDLGFWELPDPLPTRLESAVIAIEDRRFRRHPGVDLQAVLRAVKSNMAGRREGASTLAMQVVRLDHPQGRTVLAKSDEACAATLSTLFRGKRAILRRYLKIAPQGGNMYGFAYSSRRYFRKPVQDLTWAETALLLAIPQDPSGRNLFEYQGFENAKARARVILAQLEAQGVIDREEATASRPELEGLRRPSRERRPDDSLHYVLRLTRERERSPGSPPLRPTRATLDGDIQSEVASIAARTVARCRELGADNLAIMVLDVKSAEVLAYLGSPAYYDKGAKGSIDYCRVKRSSGSTIKPFLYALALESGAYSPSSVVPDMPLRVKDGEGEYGLADFDDAYLGPLLMRVALCNSRNVPAIRILDSLGTDAFYDWLGRIGLHSWEYPASHYGLGMAVGGLYASLEDLMKAYGVLASDGMSFSPRWSEDDPEQPSYRVMSEDTARQISRWLSQNENRLPSFRNTVLSEFPFPVAIKTGTSNGYHDAWCVGFSRKYLVGIWIGHSDYKSMNHVTGLVAAKLSREIFTALEPESVEGIDEEPFPPPRSWEAMRVCQVSGELSGPDCPHAVTEYFPPSFTPRQSCRVHRRILVDSRTGDPATPATPDRFRKSSPVTILSPEYASYAKSRGFMSGDENSSSLRDAGVSIRAPLHRANIRIDPDTPRRFQTIALRAEVKPVVEEIIWYVDGKEYGRAKYPYELRWELAQGEHTFTARFPNAFVESEAVSVTVR